MSRARWSIVAQTPEAVTIRDDGPWDRFPTVTNDAETVVGEVNDICGLDGRRLYYDSSGDLDEILHKDGRFTGFAPGPRPSSRR